LFVNLNINVSGIISGLGRKNRWTSAGSKIGS